MLFDQKLLLRLVLSHVSIVFCILVSHVLNSDVFLQIAGVREISVTYGTPVLLDLQVNGIDVGLEVGLVGKPLPARFAGVGLAIFQAGRVN